jgi:hypothetical protein
VGGDKLEHDLLAEFISRSRDFANLTRGKQLMKQAALALMDVFDIDSGFFVYQKQLVLRDSEMPRVYEPWGVFHELTEYLQTFITLRNKEFFDLFIKIHEK